MCGLLMLPVMILNFVINVIRWLFWKFGWWAVPMLAAAAILIGISVMVFVTSKATPMPTLTTPSKIEAPYLVETTSRYYYAASYEKDGETYILNGYWTLEGDKWVYKDQLVLTPAFGEVTIGKRR